MCALPFTTAAAGRIAVHVQCLRRHRRRCEQRGKQQGDAHAGKPALPCHSPAVGVVCHWMDTIFQLAPSFLRLSNPRLRSVVDWPLTVAWLSPSLPTMAVSTIGIDHNETGAILALSKNDIISTHLPAA